MQCVLLGAKFLGVMVDCLQRVRDLAERADDGLLVVSERGVVTLDGGLLFSLEGSAVEDRPGDSHREPPECGAAIA
ncbi:hypothetical protein D3C76_1596470 [compost metagenome]